MEKRHHATADGPGVPQTTRVSKSRPLGALRAPSSNLTSSQTKTTYLSVGIKSKADDALSQRNGTAHPRGHEASVADYVACRIPPHASVHEGTISKFDHKAAQGELQSSPVVQGRPGLDDCRQRQERAAPKMEAPGPLETQ